jgi:hypothetical protein
VIVRFGGIDGHYCLNFIFITTEKMNFNFYQVVASSVFVRGVVVQAQQCGGIKQVNGIPTPSC